MHEAREIQGSSVNIMKIIQVKIIAICLLSIFSTVAHADVSDNDIERVLNLSGLTKQVELVPSVIKAGVKQAQRENSSIPENVLNILLLQVDNSFVPSEILRDVRLKDSRRSRAFRTISVCTSGSAPSVQVKSARP